MDWIGPFWIPQTEILSNSEKNTFQLEEEGKLLFAFTMLLLILTPSWLFKFCEIFQQRGQ